MENKELFNKVYNLIISISAKYLFTNYTYKDGKHATYELCVGDEFDFNDISSKNKIKIEIEKCVVDGFNFWFKVKIEIKMGKETYIKEIDSTCKDELEDLCDNLGYIIIFSPEPDALPHEFLDKCFSWFRDAKWHYHYKRLIDHYKHSLDNYKKTNVELEEANAELENEIYDLKQKLENSYQVEDTYYDE